MLHPKLLLISLLAVLCLRADVTLRTLATPAAKRPHILWLIAEDFGPHLGCYGTKEVWTPHLDKLAAEGVRYTRMFTTAPTMPPEELYDLETDPHEINNLVNSKNPTHQAMLKRLRGVLEKWIVESDDQGRFPEPESAIRGSR